MLVKSASYCSGVGILAAMAAAKGAGLQKGTQGVAITEITGVEVVLHIQLIVKYYLSNRI